MWFSGSLRASLALVLMALAVVTQATPALSGAWPREKGTWFVSFHGGQELRWTAPSLVSTYVEYGLTETWTVGGQLEYAVQTEEMSEGKVFARWHFPSGGTWQKAVSLTLSGLEGEDIRLAPAMHFGRGLDTPLGNGWVDLSIKAELPLKDNPILRSSKALAGFAQFGVKPHDRWMTMLSLDAYADAHGTTYKVIPALAWQMPSGRHLHLEWTETLGADPMSKLSLGLWMEF